MYFSDKDIAILRKKAHKVKEYAISEENIKKAKLWALHNDLKDRTPLLFCDPETAWQEIMAEYEFQCESPEARSFEWALEIQLVHFEKIKDDFVVSDTFYCCYYADNGDWGLKEQKVGGENNTAYTWISPISDYDESFPKLKFPEPTINKEMSDEYFEWASKIFDGILKVERYHPWWWTLGMTMTFVYLRGLENMMIDMYDCPENVHKLMAFLRDGTLNFLDVLEEKNWLSSNVGNFYVGSGGFGFTDEIAKVTNNVKTQNMWGFCESQETTSISPEMFNEFVLPYQKPILKRFALSCYGCCEPLDKRWKYVKTIENLRRVSVSPWSDKNVMAENLGKNYVYSAKASPSFLAVKNMNEDVVRSELKNIVSAAKRENCFLEVIMKDTTTLGGSGENIYKFSRIAREEMSKL